jgi:hypothetical protein
MNETYPLRREAAANEASLGERALREKTLAEVLANKEAATAVLANRILTQSSLGKQSGFFARRLWRKKT